jgi:pyrimidine-nucleoside phosphorylase
MNSLRVGIISFGDREDKVFFVLSPLFSSVDLVLASYKNFDYPKNSLDNCEKNIKIFLRDLRISAIVFDLKVKAWPNIGPLMVARETALSIKKFCESQKIGASFILRNSYQPLGYAVGTSYEKWEAWEVLQGKGPFDLTKLTLEIGADMLLITKRFDRRIEAKKYLKKKIIEGEAIHKFKELEKNAPPFPLVLTEKKRLNSSRKGYLHNFSMQNFEHSKSEFFMQHAECGFFIKKKVGDWINQGESLVNFYVPSQLMDPKLDKRFSTIFKISDHPPDFLPFILDRF